MVEYYLIHCPKYDKKGQNLLTMSALVGRGLKVTRCLFIRKVTRHRLGWVQDLIGGEEDHHRTLYHEWPKKAIITNGLNRYF
jgi:hypothetical protein